MLLLQARDEPLVSTSTMSLVPVLRAPYYLGLTHRQLSPGEPAPEATRFIEIVPSLIPKERSTDEQKLKSDGSLNEVACDNQAVWMGYSDFTSTVR